MLQDIHEVANRLARLETRAAEATRIAQGAGADAFLIFLYDAAVASLTPAPGFPQTVPGGPLWRAFLENRPDCGSTYTLQLPFPDQETLRPARFFVCGRVVYLLIGGPADVPLARFADVPLLSALLEAEAERLASSGLVSGAREATERAKSLARALDRARDEISSKAMELSAALSKADCLNRELSGLNQTLEQRIAEAVSERKLLADLVENTDAFVQVADRDFRWLAINKASADEFERIFGVRPKVGDSMLDALADMPEHQAAVRAVWSRALAGEAFTEVGEFGDPGRGRRSYEMKYHVLRGENGEQIGAYQFVYDVTERVREQRRLAEAEAAQREADALYRAYFENSPEALFVVGVESDGGFVVEQVNPAHEAGVGLKLEDIKGKRIDQILPGPVAQRILETYNHVVETGTIYQYREQFDLNGEQHHWDTSLVPVRDENGRIVRILGSSRNVTRQVFAEDALRQSQKMEAMGQLTGGVAHDFNNLLTPIVGALDMLQRKGLGSEREQRLIAGAAQSAERAKVLVQRLLAFARRQPLQPVAVDVRTIVENMADLLSSTTGPQIKVVVEMEDALPSAKADANQLEMALLNLAVNARDAMPQGGVLRIRASAGAVPPNSDKRLRPGRYVRVSVADTGIGMDEATLSRAIEPFYSTKGVGKGTGLGLSMVHGLALQLGGVLTIKSKSGLGTNVELWLPQTEEAPESLSLHHVTESSRTSGTVLLVEDEELVRLSTADMLSDLGFCVIEVSTAEEALDVVGNGVRLDLIVTDHLMPGMTGTELARLVRDQCPDLPVLIVSGYAEVDGIAPDLPRLTKPFRKDELAATVAALFP